MPDPNRSKSPLMVGRSLIALALFFGVLAMLFGAIAIRMALDTGSAWESVGMVLLTTATILFGFAAVVLLSIGVIRVAMAPVLEQAHVLEKETVETRDLLTLISERLLISSAAKRIAYRDKDRAALRQAIEEDIDKCEFDAAITMVEEMSRTYGYRQEAEQLRERIESVRSQHADHGMQASRQRLDAIIDTHDWDRALAESDKMARLYPQSEAAKHLRQHVVDAREHFKHQLERRFLEAAERDDVETALDVLKELDQYLSEREAEPLRETARGVIGKKRQNLGVRYKMAVHDHDFTDALRVAKQIIRDFPNTKMAFEVRSHMDALHQRAHEHGEARVHAGV